MRCPSKEYEHTAVSTGFGGGGGFPVGVCVYEVSALQKCPLLES